MPMASRLALLAPRRGHSPAEYEDAFAADECAGRFAVADGADRGLLHRPVGQAAGRGLRGRQRAASTGAWPASLPALQERWDAEVSARDLPWYAERA